ncbi:uncharacterized protein LOC142225482 [Haematobia irritans]|uniref:uncharacterized protein LOC142225482 n=1 Tax=Haematobia irritans TaxID=7368 RepID=UPI003F502AC0
MASANDSSTQINLELLLANVNIAQQVVEYLDYKDQLNVARVCTIFEDVVRNFVWKTKYREVELIITDEMLAISNFTRENFDDILNSEYELGENRMYLEHTGLVEFLELNASNIEHFYIFGAGTFKYPVVFPYHFPNVKSIMYYNMCLSDRALQILGKKCPKLEKLILRCCTNVNGENLILGKDIDLATFQNMPNLKSLSLTKSYSPRRIGPRSVTYDNVQAILSTLSLKELHLDETIFHPETPAIPNKKKIISVKKPEPPNTYEELEIGEFRSTDDIVAFYKKFLGKYINLRKLSINAYRDHFITKEEHFVPKQFFTIINKSCNKLDSLTITQCKISNFVPMKTLTELKLFKCNGMSWTNLKQILEDMPLVSFSTENTFYSGTATPIYVSSTLRRLQIDLPERCFNEYFPEQFKQVTHLEWCCFKHPIMEDIPKNFPNLQELNIRRMQPVEIFFKLKSLKKITILFHANFGEVLVLLGHPTLQEITFSEFMTSKEVKVEDPKAVPTNVNFMSIMRTTFLNYFDFWLDMLSINPYLILAVEINIKFCLENDVFSKLVGSTKLPQRLKYIKVHGFKIDITNLKDNYDETIQKIEKIGDIMTNCPQRCCLML